MRKTGISIRLQKKSNHSEAVERDEKNIARAQDLGIGIIQRLCDLWADYFTFRSFNFIICNLGIKISAHPRGVCVN